MQWNKPSYVVNERVPPHRPQNIKVTYFLKTELWCSYYVKSLILKECVYYTKLNTIKTTYTWCTPMRNKVPNLNWSIRERTEVFWYDHTLWIQCYNPYGKSPVYWLHSLSSILIQIQKFRSNSFTVNPFDVSLFSRNPKFLVKELVKIGPKCYITFVSVKFCRNNFNTNSTPGNVSLKQSYTFIRKETAIKKSCKVNKNHHIVVKMKIFIFLTVFINIEGKWVKAVLFCL